MTTVLKLGGELLEDAAAIGGGAQAIARLTADGPAVVVHGGGRAIDADLRARGIAPRFVDGLRVTDEATLESVVTILAGRANTALVAALGRAGCRAVGLTGADASLGRCTRAPRLQTVGGDSVDLGLVGEPGRCDVALLADLMALGYVPVVASLGVGADGTVLNVNADALAAALAASLGAATLIIAGTTAGVLDAQGATIPALSLTDIEEMTAAGTAHSGMIAKLNACRRALEGGVSQVSIVAGRGVDDFRAARGTRVALIGDARAEARALRTSDPSDVAPRL
jgi:acetylglutamate kinase